MKNLFSFYLRKHSFSQNIVQQLLSYTNILSRGYPTKLKTYGNSRRCGDGWGRQATLGMKIPGGWGSKAKVPSVGGIDIFFNYTLELMI